MVPQLLKLNRLVPVISPLQLISDYGKNSYYQLLPITDAITDLSLFISGILPSGEQAGHVQAQD